MKVLVGTDFHGKEAVFEGFAEKAEEERVDILVICGDITHFGTIQEAKRLLSILTRLRLPVLFVPGNCDPPSLVGVDVEGTICIHGKNVFYEDITFLGVGASPPTPFHTPFEISEKTIMKTLSQASNNLPVNRWIVLVSHTPPYGTRLDQAFLGQHAGSRSVRRFIEERRPSIVFCGHIHEGRGEDRINSTIIVNPGPARHGDYAKVFFDNNITFSLDSL